jgi:hypothetical protein
MLLTYYSQIQNIDKQVNLNGINSLHKFYQRLVNSNELLVYCLIYSMQTYLIEIIFIQVKRLRNSL